MPMGTPTSLYACAASRSSPPHRRGRWSVHTQSTRRWETSFQAQLGCRQKSGSIPRTDTRRAHGTRGATQGGQRTRGGDASTASVCAKGRLASAGPPPPPQAWERGAARQEVSVARRRAPAGSAASIVRAVPGRARSCKGSGPSGCSFPLFASSPGEAAIARPPGVPLGSCAPDPPAAAAAACTYHTEPYAPEPTGVRCW